MTPVTYISHKSIVHAGLVSLHSGPRIVFCLWLHLARGKVKLFKVHWIDYKHKPMTRWLYRWFFDVFAKDKVFFVIGKETHKLKPEYHYWGVTQ